MIAGEEERLLISALDVSVEEIEKRVHELKGIFIAAHIDRPSYSLISQLGFIPKTLKLDGVELMDISKREEVINAHSLPENLVFITSSDAHYPHQIGTRFVELQMKEATFEELRKSFL
jgi:PHP family Zn ribbon phosphoesterase